MSGVHEVAESGFGTAAEAYERARPGYPPEVVGRLAEWLSLAPGRRIIDLAAGTGKLTRLLAPAGADLLAVEPVAGMRAVLALTCPGVPVIAATAEDLPVATAAIDGITVAQAFHWFDAPRALDEMARVLRPGGSVALVWNARDRSEPWVDAAWSVMDRVERRAPWRDHDAWRDSALREHPEFCEPLLEQHRHVQTLGRAALLDRFASVSHVAVLPGAERAEVLAEIAGIVDGHPATAGRAAFAIPYRVDCVLVERR
jgi:SAM-dependent methyltransferase